MLQNIRKASKGWVSWLIVIAISIPFALWGIERFSTHGGSGDDVLAYIGDHEITYFDFYRELNDYNRRLQNQYGENFNRIDQQRVRQSVLQFLFGRGVVFADASAQGMVISDSQVKRLVLENENFQKDDGLGFDSQKYIDYLSVSNLSAPVFEDNLRQSEIYNQYTEGFWSSNFLTKYELRQLYQLLNHERKMAYVILPWEQVEEEVEVTDDEITVKYQEDENRFAVPEKVKIDYVSVSIEGLADKVVYTDEQLNTYFEQHKSDFSTSEEREVRHILFAKEDKDLADEVRLQVLSGEDFTQLAQKHSIDTVSAQEGGNLGLISRGVMVEAFEDVAFSMQENEVVLVETEFGYHVVEVTKINKATSPTLDEVKEEVILAYQLGQASDEFYAMQETLSNLAFDHPDSLQQIEENLSLSVQQSDWFSRIAGTSSDTITQFIEIREAAFSPQVKNDRLNSTVINVEGQQMVVLRVNEVQPAYIRPLVEVKEELKKELAKTKASDRLREIIQEAVPKLRSKQLTWGDFIKQYEVSGHSQPRLDWVSSRDINEETPIEKSEVYSLLFDTPRVRAKNEEEEQGVFLESQTSLGNVFVVYMTNSKDVQVSEEDITEESEIWGLMNNFQTANLRNATLEVLQIRYPLPRVDVNDLVTHY